MVVSEAIQREIEEKVELYDAAKERIKARIESNISIAVGRLETIKSELLDEMDEEFGKNPFAEFLGNDNSCTDADAKRLLAEQKIPENFGPGEKSFSALFRDIDSLKEWRNFAPKNLKVKNITWDSIIFTWDEVNDASFYQVEVDGRNSWKTSTMNTFIKRGLLPGTEHSFRVRTVSKWSDAVKGRTQKIPIPLGITAKSIACDSITLTWDKVEKASSYQIEVDGNNSWETSTRNSFTKRGLLPETVHSFRVRTMRGSSVSKWSGVVKGKTLKAPEFSECVWKGCPSDVDEYKKYSVNEKNLRAATKINSSDYDYCTIIGNTHIPLNKVTSWNIKVLKSKYNDGDYIYIGVAPFDINQNDANYNKCGWYFNCYRSKLWSGPPHNYICKEYGPRKWVGGHVHTGDSVGVVMDTTRGDLSFVLNGVNRGVAYEGISLDKPLVPCVLLYWQDDSVELDISEVEENIDSSVPVPSKITAKSITWDSITLIWDKVSYASFFQVEVDGNNSWETSTMNSFTNSGLLPETEHSFRVRTVRGSSVSEWSDIVKGRTLKAPEFSECVWKECPDGIVKSRKYSVGEKNPRVATKVNYDDCCTIIGNTPIPPNTVTSWGIKILEPKKNNSRNIYIGVAPNDINQNVNDNCNKCGWYFNCYRSKLYSGPPHNYRTKIYGPKKWSGEYVHTGDSVGVVMDITNGDLSFVLDGVNLGVAYCGIPLDKPLVPCILLGYQGDSIELDTSEVKENVDSSIPVLSNITTKSATWDSITLTWDKVIGASFYQIEVDGSKSWYAPTTNTFTKRGLLPETEHSFRVRTVRGSSASEWSGVVKGRTLKAPEFSECVWEECPDGIVKSRKYSVDKEKPRVATKNNKGCSTIIGSTPIPLNTVTSWSIKIFKSRINNGYEIYIGVAPSDINQNTVNYDKCGWYFDCYYSSLWSGPPHSYSLKEYGPRKGGGEYVHTGDSVGVVIDTTRGDLSFVLNGVNLGVAYEGIPLDKPLVPCVLLKYESDSVELDTSEVKENVDSSIPVLSNITAKSITWDSIIFTWNEVSDASFYQIEVDGSKSWGAATTNTFVKRGLLPETEHSFRVRAVGGSSVSEWSGVVKRRTQKIPIPSKIIVKDITWDSITLTWDKVADASFFQVEVDGSNSGDSSTTNLFTKRGLLPETEHSFRVRAVGGSSVSEWSSVVKGRTLWAYECVWKECPRDVYEYKKYSVDEKNPRVATKANSGGRYCTIIGNIHIPLNTVTSWSIEVLGSKYNNGDSIWIGIAPSDINQNDDNHKKCGWYFDCYRSTLWSGPPHNYSGKEYGPWKNCSGWYVHTGDSVGVVMDTTRGDLSFVLNGVNLGAAFEGIPLDKPLVPCVLLICEGDSVKLVTSEAKEKVDSSVPIPSNITAKSITWNSIALTWDEVDNASFYQIEVDGSKSWDATTTNAFIKSGLLPETEHSFRVRAVRGNSVSEWSDVVKGRTLKESFETSWWKECPSDVGDNREYSVDEGNPRVATMDGSSYCTIIGNTYIPLNAITSWSIKVLESDNNNGDGIFIGIAPYDINQNNVDNYNKCGWYFDCWSSTLCSGPPHSYKWKEYGSRKEKGQYVHTGDSLGVVVDTSKGDLSFVLNRVNLGVAYCGIPLDKPLVPCILLGYQGDSVELDTSEVKEAVDSSVPIPSNITAKSTTWDSITLTWDEVANASFYQVEVDGNNSGDASTTNAFTKRGLPPNTEHSFRVRTVRGSSVSEWSGAVKGRTLKAPEFSECVWRKCPDDVDGDRKYSVDGRNPRVATKIKSGCYCTIIGNTYIPLNAITSWSIKIHKTKDDGWGIFIGIAPNDINQNVEYNYDKCGWYFYCYCSELYSGPPHNYWNKKYGPEKNYGQYVHTGDSVGVVIDATKGDLSFVLNGVNRGVAFEGIPLDKPLVPCVLLWYQGDSIELII